MKKVSFILMFVTISVLSLDAYPTEYVEQFYRLYHLHFYQAPDDTMENIWYLERALKAPFANPLYALAKIENPVQYKRYRYLLTMHINLLLIKLYLELGNKWDKQVAYFYNYPWKDQNLDSLNRAEQLYKVALGYWKEARQWSKKAYTLRRIHFERIQNWEDENWRIENNELDYGDIISEHLARLERVRRDFENMDESTFPVED